jgi:hypothetical protein
MRIRERSTGPTYDTLEKEYTVDGVTTPFSSHVSLAHAKSESIRDVVTPGFYRRINNGDVINNPCNINISENISGGGSYNAVGTGPNDGKSYATFGGSITSYHMSNHSMQHITVITDDDIASRIALTKLRALAAVDSTPFAFGEDMLEIRETLRFLRDPLYTLRNIAERMRKFYRSRTRKGINSQKAFADMWLEYRFAVSPLVQSAMSIIEAYNDTTSKRPKRRTARGFSTHTDETSDSAIGYYTPSIYDEFSRKGKVTVDIHSGILYEVSNPVNDMNFRLGLRLKDIPETLWNIVPLSFMVDRLVDISSSISGFVNLVDPSVTILAGWTRVKTESEKEIQFNAQTNPNWSVQVSGDVVKEKSFSYDRSPWNPSVADLVPSFTPDNLVSDVTKTLDLLQLMRNRWKF